MQSSMMDFKNASNAEALECEIPGEGEGFRLVIWDLDETFWQGTVTEGGITKFITANEGLVVTLAARGIMSSICSKNSFDQVKRVLEDRGIWEYFVFPSIDWSPKSARIAQIIDNMKLRAATVLFIDDNSLNRAEAIAAVEGLTVVSERAIPAISHHDRFKGKDDAGLSRLEQYKVLEQRKSDAKIAGADNRAFLLSSGIRVTIERDVEKYVDRAVELINRTNQLNFTKLRLPEDPEAAREQLLERVKPRWAWAGLVHVADRYGDYGFVGFFLGFGTDKKRLEHFCFSCRTLGMGVEKYVYQQLGAPALTVAGEVVADVFDPTPVDWINLQGGGVSDIDESLIRMLPQLRLRGGCDLDPILHYCGVRGSQLFRELNDVCNHTFFRRDVISTLYCALEDPGEAFWTDIQRLGFGKSTFESHFFDAAPEGTILFLSIWGETYVHHYRHRKTGQVVGFSPNVTRPFDAYLRLKEDPDTDLSEFLAHHADSDVEARAAAEQLIRGLAEHFDFTWANDVTLFRDMLKRVLSRVPQGCRLVIIQPPLRGRFNGEKTDPRTVNIREATSATLPAFPFAREIDIESCVANEGEVCEGWHFDRMVYFRLFQAAEALLRNEGRSWPIKARQH